MELLITVDKKEYSIDYEVSNLTDTHFDLSIWYYGKEIREKCPRYLANPEEDIISPHGPMLLQKLLFKLNQKSEQVDTDNPVSPPENSKNQLDD